MSADTIRKPRSDSRLKTLPEEAQRRLAEICAKEGLEGGRKHLLKDGTRTSLSALSSWLRWWQAMERLRSAGSLSAAMQDFLKSTGCTEEEAISRSAAAFTAMTAADSDAKSFAGMLNALSNWNNSRSRIALAEKKAQQAEKQTGPQTLTPAEKAEKIREAFGLGGGGQK